VSGTALELHLGERVTTTSTSLDLGLESALSIGEWSEIGRSLGRMGNAALWWIGDWMSVGEKAYGSTYDEAEAITGYATQTLKNITQVCRNVPPAVRTGALSFAHHAEVASLDRGAQEAWLMRAQAEGLTREQLREQVRGTRALPPGDAPLDVRFHLAVVPERAERWKAAAEQAGVDFAEWAADVLDRAAA
jgi:hypothetical protein